MGGAAASARPLIIFVPHGSEASGWPSTAPAGVTGRGGGRPRRCARAAVGHHRQPRAARSQAPRDGPGADRRAQPALPPRRGGEGWARRPAYLRGRTRGRGGVGILLRVIVGGLTLELGGRRERKLPCDGPSRAPGKAPGRLTIERPSDRRSPGRNPGPQGAFEERREEGGAARPPTARRDGPAPRQASPLGSQPPRFQERFQALGPGASPPPTRARGVSRGGSGPGQPRRRRSLPEDREEPRESSKPSARSTGQGTWQRGEVSAPPARRPSARRGRESPVPRRAAPSRASRPGLAHPPALVGWSRGSLAGPGSSSPRPPCRPRTAGLSVGGPSPGWHYDSVYPPRVVPGGRGFRLGRGLTFPPCRSRRVRSRGGARAPPFRSPVPPSREGRVLLAGGARTRARSSLPGAPAAADRSASQGCARARAGPCAWGCCVLGGSRGLSGWRPGSLGPLRR
ncbi:hypothetical protein NDU88_000816 [Pleurodeles waltl]|uniref:Uncharacterized protein n=1 Tax=Pleurodeles waltl TaxID=8319 RepID=A0AAV7TGI8_PLEWA|nr:hypothetical protein NDU88_000816 [Pleurodeles waltl]